MKQSAVEKVTNELRAEKAVIDGLLDEFNDPTEFRNEALRKRDMLAACIIRLTNGNGAEAPKPPRARKRRTATGGDL